MSTTSHSLPANMSLELLTVQRLTCHTSTPFTTVTNRFRSFVPQISLQAFASATSAGEIEKLLEDTLATAQNEAGEKVEYGFIRFQEFNHGRWTKFFAPDYVSEAEQRSNSDTRGDDVASELDQHLRLGHTRFAFGNYLVALTMIREDVEAGLHIPPSVLFTEQEGGGTKATLLMPSDLIGGDATAARVADGERWERLMYAARALEKKILKLMEDVMR